MVSPLREKVINEVKLTMGSGMIDLELDPEHYDFAVSSAIDRYRVRSGNSMEESFIFIDMQPGVAAYTLPNEVQEVRAIYRRSMGGSAGGATVDPFSLAFTNNIYMIQNPGSLSTGGAGFLATYDFAMQYQELVGRMFGRDMMFTFESVSKRLTIQRNVTAVETIALHTFNARPDEVLLADVYAKPWIRDYAVAKCKMMLGEARSKFQSLGGPQGGVSLNGDALKSEAKEEMDRLEEEVKNLIEQNQGYGFIIG